MMLILPQLPHSSETEDFIVSVHRLNEDKSELYRRELFLNKSHTTLSYIPTEKELSVGPGNSHGRPDGLRSCNVGRMDSLFPKRQIHCLRASSKCSIF